MTTSPDDVARRLVELVGLFNRGAVDLPDRALDPGCVFRLNGRAYHEHLGRPASDPLVRLIGCGPAGYRMLAARVRYLVEGARVVLHADERRDEHVDSRTVTVGMRATLSGQVRGRPGTQRIECSLAAVAGHAGPLLEIAGALGDADLEMLMAARES